jgi:hypothetical protein
MMVTMAEDHFAASREFYRERLRDSFRYSGNFFPQTGRAAQDVADKPEFENILSDASAGSLEAARRIGEMAVVHLLTVSNAPGPWWRDLCNYERGYFLQDATTDHGQPTNRPRRGVSALCTNFTWNMPDVVKRLKQGEPITDDLRRPVTLLFSRNESGAVQIVEVGPAVEKVFRMTNGQRRIDQIASAAEIPLPETEQMLKSLSGIGAIVLGKSAEEIMEILRQQGKA